MSMKWVRQTQRPTQYFVALEDKAACKNCCSSVVEIFQPEQ